MARQKQSQTVKTVKKTIKKAQNQIKNMLGLEDSKSRSKSKGRERKAPGSTGEGEYYHIEVRPDENFVTYRTQDVGDPGHVQRVAGKRSSGSWATVKWLIGKEDARVEDGMLIPVTGDAREVIEKLGSEVRHKTGDIFEARPRRNVPEKDKPTPAQQRARRQNIKKPQAARKNKSKK